MAIVSVSLEKAEEALETREGKKKKSSCFLCAKSLFTWTVRLLFRGTQRLFSVKYLSGEAKLV